MTKADKGFFDKYLDIVQRLQVPKIRNNEFGGFQYRSVEDIEEKLKPLLKEHNLGFYFYDEVEERAGSAFVVAHAVLFDVDGNELRGKGSARLAEKPKAKTDDAQLTGGASSYAKKYAAQGLFLIDEGKDDPDNPNIEKAAAVGATTMQRSKAKLFQAFKKAGIEETVEMMAAIQSAIGKDSVDTIDDVDKVIKSLEE